MGDQFNPAVPPIPLTSQGAVLSMQGGVPAFVGGVTTLFNSAVPVGIPSSGSIGNNGALTGLTGFATTYPGIYLFFPVNAIATGSAAGLYYCQMSSATAGTIFNNPLPAGQRPVLIRSPTPFVTTGPGAYTQSIASQNLLQCTVKAGSLETQGACEIYNLFSLHNSANGKIANIVYGGATVQTFNLTTVNSYENLLWVYNTGQVDRQVLSPPGPTAFGGTATANSWLSVNTGNDFNIVVNATITNAAEYIVLEGFSVRAEVSP